VLLFISLSSLGLAYPNAAALALVPFDRNIGIFNSHTLMPVALILAATSCIGFAILIIGKRRIHGLRYVEEKDANLLPD
jgi:MFS transporter, DHA1 family, multidrug resistance protein